MHPITQDVRKTATLAVPFGRLATGGRPRLHGPFRGHESRPSTTSRSIICGRSTSARGSRRRPMTSRRRGEQYIAIASGGTSPLAVRTPGQHTGTEGDGATRRCCACSAVNFLRPSPRRRGGLETGEAREAVALLPSAVSGGRQASGPRGRQCPVDRTGGLPERALRLVSARRSDGRRCDDGGPSRNARGRHDGSAAGVQAARPSRSRLRRTPARWS
jgi:hypothetical protein